MNTEPEGGWVGQFDRGYQEYESLTLRSELQDLRDGCEEALRAKDEEIATLKLRIDAAERAADAAIETARSYEAAWRRVEREVGKLLKSKGLSS